MDVDFRVLEFGDYEELTGLWKRAGLKYRPEGRDAPKRVQAEMEAGRAVYLCAYRGGELIGSVIATEDGRRGWINRLAVDPGFRRRGLAGRLVEKVEEVFRARGLSIVAALVEEENTASLELFQECGYVLDRSICYLSKREGSWV